jgi:DNA-binding SARP family transcriptional activator
MPLTQPEIDDVLAKAAAYQQSKALSNDASESAKTASARANEASQAWDAVINDGETDAAKLTALLQAVVDSGQVSKGKQDTAQAAQSAAGQAQTAMSDAVYYLINPPPPPEP